jgi:hypothetical protein
VITFAVFHYDMPAALRRLFMPHGQDVEFDFVGMLDLALRSAERFHPGCQKVVLTDLVTDFSRLPRDVRIIRHPIDPTQALFDRAVAQRDFLVRHDFASHVILMDSDVLINNELESSFDGSFDVGLTYRSIKAMPLNAGLIALHAGRSRAAVTFFDAMLRAMRAHYSSDPGWLWLSDQFGLIEAVGRQAFWARTEDRLQTDDGVRIRLWPCETHNDSVINEWRAILVRDPRRRVLHFKGDVKRLMQPYWSAHLDGDRSVAGRAAQRTWLVALAVAEFLSQGAKAPDQLAMRLFRAMSRRARRLAARLSRER